MRGTLTALCCFVLAAVAFGRTDAPVNLLTYPIVDTGQTQCFSNTGQLRRIPRPGQAFYGQDAFYEANLPRYRNNKDGTITDLNTGLMWQKDYHQDRKQTFHQAKAKAKTLKLAGYTDWRLPTIKALYSLIDFNGCVRARTPVPYIDTNYFKFRFGDEGRGERIIDAQYWSSTEYVGTTMDGQATVFGVNFADGRIKGYPCDRGMRGGANRQFVRYVRGNPDYGKNRYVDNKDGTVSDLATGLMWTKADSGKTMNWQQALAYCEKLKLAGHSDWRGPNAKELHSIVDYTRAPDAKHRARRGPAINPIFNTTDGEGWFWSSTTHLDGRVPGERAVYIAFGRATGFMGFRRGEPKRLMNVHGAGAQRSDPKSGDPNSPRYAAGIGPQGDVIRILNYVRAVRSINPQTVRIVQPSTKPIPPSSLGRRDEHRGPRRPGRRPGGW